MLLPLLFAACLDPLDCDPGFHEDHGVCMPDADTGEADADTDADADADADTDTDTDPACDDGANLCGEVVILDECATSLPPTVNVWTVQEGATACGGDDTGGLDWKNEQVSTPAVADGVFQDHLDPADYAVDALWENGYGCTPFTIAGEEQVHVLLELEAYAQDWAPYLYLYPAHPTAVRVRLPGSVPVLQADPAYPDGGWEVLALPDGTLLGAGAPRDFLFYELALDPRDFQYDEGWCVAGSWLQASLEAALEDWGFLPEEVADFADFWDGNLPEAPAFTVYPQVGPLYPLRVHPRPDHLLRVQFVLEPGCREVAAPEVVPGVRAGFHAAEWGVILLPGTEGPE